MNDTKRNLPDAFFMATRAWADANPKDVKAFQDALADGVAFATTNEAKTQENTALYLKQDLKVVQQAGKQHFCTPDLAKHIGELNAIMQDVGLAKTPMDASKVVWKQK
jgi:ABC-type nitrate/sulfonate/bicarbonate transport system substrate-binding protein